MDYIVFQFLFYFLRLAAPPVIAAGDNLNITVVGEILRRGGAFFIRRSFGGPDGPLYTAVVSAYVECLMKHGANILFFPEGGRSRSGKLLQPKVGMLGMVLEPIVHGRLEDAYVVPLSIYYDRVLETGTYVNELLGAQKRKESLAGVLGQTTRFINSKWYGNIHVRVAPGFSAKSFVHRHISVQHAGNRPNFDPKGSHEDMGVLLKALAYSVLDEINRVSGITPTALVGTAMICSMGHGHCRTDLMRKVNWLRNEVCRSGGHVPNYFKFPGELSEEVLESALKVLGNLVTEEPDLLEPVYTVSPGKHFEMTYYRNMCVHVFVHQAIIAAALHKQMRQDPALQELQVDAMRKDVAFLSRLLKVEFVFASVTSASLEPPAEGKAAAPAPRTPVHDRGAFSPQQQTALLHNFQVALDHLTEAKIIDVSNDMIKLDKLRRIRRNDDVQVWNEHFIFLCCLIWPVIESYWVVLAGLVYVLRHGLTNISEAETVSRIHAFSKTLLSLGYVHYPEGAFVEPLRAALRTYVEMGHVQYTRPAGGAWKLSLGPVYQSAGEQAGCQALQHFLEEVASYRMRPPDQEGMADFPKHIAKLAFGGTPAAKL